MAGVGLLGAFVTLLTFAFRNEDEVEISAAQLAQSDRYHQAEVVL
jgi:cytochrome o ubiquinol oxidase subunit 1